VSEAPQNTAAKSFPSLESHPQEAANSPTAMLARARPTTYSSKAILPAAEGTAMAENARTGFRKVHQLIAVLALASKRVLQLRMQTMCSQDHKSKAKLLFEQSKAYQVT